MHLKSTRSFFHLTPCDKVMLFLSGLQVVGVVVAMICTRLGFLRQFEYEGVYTFFPLITGPIVWISAEICSNCIVKNFALGLDDWHRIVLLPGIINIVFVCVQNLLLGKLVSMIAHRVKARTSRSLTPERHLTRQK